MTNDYKNILLKYLTGNLAIGTGTNEPQFGTPTSATNNIKTNLDTYFGVGKYTIYGSIQGKDVNNNGLPLNVVYGGYEKTADTTLYGFIYILNTDFSEIQMVTEYIGGTDLGIIEVLNVADDGTFYGIEITGTSSSPSKRLVLLNNFLLKLPTSTTYEVVYRIGYTLPTNMQDTFYIRSVIKNENAGFYLICGVLPNVTSEMQPIAEQLEIVVGGDNVWTEYRTATETFDFYLANAIASWDSNNNVSFKMTGWLSDELNDRHYTEYTNSSTTLIAYTIATPVSNITYYTALAIDNDTTYVEYTVGEPPTFAEESIFLGYIDYTTNSIVNIFTLYNISTLETSRFYFFMCDGQPFYAFISNSATTTYTIKVGKLIGVNYYETTLGTISGSAIFAFTVSLFNMTNQFNLYDYFFQVDNTVFECKQVYNLLNYNGISYIDTNSLVPESSILYDASDNIIFARNLYNLAINDNTTTSTIEIPNNFLNDVTIATESLFSETNTEMIENVQNITKNVYESVLMNFINTIIMSNKNNINNIIYNKVGATRLNNSVSDTNDYINTSALKMNVIFSDDTTSMCLIDKNNITYSGNEATILFAYYVPTGKTITKLQIMSYDELTIYNEITTNLIENKYYTINQKVEVV